MPLPFSFADQLDCQLVLITLDFIVIIGFVI